MHKILEKWYGLEALLKFDNAFQLIINRLFFPKTGSTIYRLNGLEILIDHSAGEHNGTRSCLASGLYDPCFELMTDLPRAISVLDLGANGGGFLMALQNSGFKIEQAVAVELNPFTHSRLQLNLMRNIPQCNERVKILNGAAESADGSISVRLGQGSVGDSIDAQPSEGVVFEIPTYSLVTLCNFFPKEQIIDICKIDIEGAEYHLISSESINDLKRFRNIIIEIHDVHSHSKQYLIDIIISAGFEKVNHMHPLPEDTVYHFTRSIESEPFNN